MNSQPSSTFKQELREYRNDVEMLWVELVQLNSNISIMREIAYPSNESNSQSYVGFSKTVFISLYQSSISIFWKIILDDNKKVLTINKLRDNFFRSNIDDDDSRKMKENLKSINFKEKFDKYMPNLRNFRHECVAHLNRKINLEQNEDYVRNYFTERKNIVNELIPACELVNKYFGALCILQKRAHLLFRDSRLFDDYSNDLF